MILVESDKKSSQQVSDNDSWYDCISLWRKWNNLKNAIHMTDDKQKTKKFHQTAVEL